MAVTATHAFTPRLVDQIDEAFERCGIDPDDLKARHIRSAIRSANLMSTDWQNFGYSEYQLVFDTFDVTQGVSTFQLPVGGYDIFHATIERDGGEREVYPISRSDYNALHKKDIQGQPDRYFVDRSTFVGADPRATVYLYQSPDRTGDQIRYWYMRKQYDVGDPANTLDMSPAFYEAFAAGLAYHLSRKFAPERTDRLGRDYLGRYYDDQTASAPGGALGRALAQNRETSDAVLRVSYERFRGRR